MEKITFINSKGQSVELGNDSPFILTKIEGTGAVNVDIQTQKSPFQDGEIYIDNRLEPRSLSIEIMVLAEDKKEMMKNRRKLLQVFNPKLGPGKLIYEFGNNRKEIEAISELAPVFPAAGDFKDTMQPSLIQLLAPEPFFKDIEGIETDLVTWIPNLEFDAVEGFSTEQTPNTWIETAVGSEGFEELESGFGVGEAIEFGYRLTKQIVEIENIGDVDAPIRVVFRAQGQVEKPYIQDVETREMIRINKTLEAGDVLEITTEFGNKNVYLNGEKAHHYLDFLNSTWIQLKPGVNLIKYGAESGVDMLECRLYYTPQYLGV